MKWHVGHADEEKDIFRSDVVGLRSRVEERSMISENEDGNSNV